MLPVHRLVFVIEMARKVPKSGTYLAESASVLETLANLLEMVTMGMSKIKPVTCAVLGMSSAVVQYSIKFTSKNFAFSFHAFFVYTAHERN